MDADINWRLNRTKTIAQYTDVKSGMINETGTLVYTLTIPAIPKYNGTEVTCVAFFLDSSPELTPAVTLTIIAGWLHYYYRDIMLVTDD